jgi:hypothetical protein
MRGVPRAAPTPTPRRGTPRGKMESVNKGQKQGVHDACVLVFEVHACLCLFGLLQRGQHDDACVLVLGPALAATPTCRTCRRRRQRSRRRCEREWVSCRSTRSRRPPSLWSQPFCHYWPLQAGVVPDLWDQTPGALSRIRLKVAVIISPGPLLLPHPESSVSGRGCTCAPLRGA